MLVGTTTRLVLATALQVLRCRGLDYSCESTGTRISASRQSQSNQSQADGSTMAVQVLAPRSLETKSDSNRQLGSKFRGSAA
ncbi:hypothetical protein GGI42DRAFT_233668 [Trichoderma sp. SZMC 28013]